jgi:plasmid stabilization system protein ParE
MRVRISAAARDDIARVLAYLMERNPAVASQLSGRFREQIGRLGTFPELGRPVDRLGTGLRLLIVEAHLIFYRVRPDEVTVIRVVDGRMNINPELFG